MRQVVLAAAFAIPFGAAALAQQDGSTAEEIGEATGDAVERTIEGIGAAGEAIGDALQETGDELERESEVVEQEVEVAEPIAREQAPDELRGEWVTGTTITTLEGETIGTIDDVIIDAETGEVTAAIVSVGGFLGVGAKQIAVPWEELQIDRDADAISVELTREEAAAAPEYVFRERGEPAAAAD